MQRRMTEISIDWLTCTMRQVTQPEDLSWLANSYTAQSAIPCKPSTGYRWAGKTTGGILVQSSDRIDMGTNWVVSGAAMTDLIARLGMPAFNRLVQACKSVSRLDLAIDVKSNLVRNCELAARSCEYRSKAQGHTIIEDSYGGLTIYIGSRSSERCMRIYDKAAQLQQPGPWTRVELELKRGWAYGAANEIAGRVLPLVVLSLVRDFVQFPTIKAWSEMLQDAAYIRINDERELHDTRHWLLTTVAKTMRRLIDLGDTTILNDFIEFVQDPPR
jgi:hypothetical protein